MKYQEFVQIINQNTISSEEVSRAIKILVTLDPVQLEEKNFQKIEDFIVALNPASKTKTEDKGLKQILFSIRDRKITKH